MTTPTPPSLNDLDAELATQKIEELKEQELQYRSVVLSQKHKEEVADPSQFSTILRRWTS